MHGAGERDIATWPLANGELLKLRLCYYKSREFLDLRRWYKDDAGELRPTPKGIRINSELAGELADLLGQVAEGVKAEASP